MNRNDSKPPRKTLPIDSEVRRLRRPHRGISRNVVIGGLAGLLLASFSVLGLYIYMIGSEPTPTEKLETAMRILRKGGGDVSFRIAKSLDPKVLNRKADRSKREFLIGVNERKAAEDIVQRRIASQKNEAAVKHLEKSRDLSFPDGHEGQGNYYLGMALFDLFRWDEAEAPLEIAAERWPQGRADAIERLVDIDISLENQDPESALARIEHWRSLPRSTANEFERTVVKEMQALYSLGEFEKCANLHAQTTADSPLRTIADLVHGRCLQRFAERAQEPERTDFLKKAMDDFRRVLASPKTSVSTRRQSNLELGRVIRDLGELSQAVSTFSALRLSSPFEPESLVSGLEEIDCSIELKRIADAADTLEHMTKNFGEAKWYLNDWMALSDIRKRVVASGERMIDSEDYQDAARFADNLLPICDELDRLRIRSRLYEQWAKHELDAGRDSPVVRSHFGTAAEAYEALASKQLRMPQYNDLLWRGIENYRMAGAYNKSNQLLENHFLRYEPRENQPKGLLIMARNYNALEKPELATLSLNRILESNTSTPLVYDARLEAAKLAAAREDYYGAENLLSENLSGDLTPESHIWKESLFLLSDILYRRGLALHDQASEAMIRDPSKSYDTISLLEKSYKELIQAINRTDEGLTRFENDPRRLQMLYTMANAYRRAASFPDILLRENRIANQDTLAAWKSQRKELFDQSRQTYAKIVREITAITDPTKKNTNTEDFLRNSFFGVADLLFEAGDYEEAIAAYQETARHFLSEPESLEAMLAIANAQKKLGKISESRRTLTMTKDILSRIPPEKNARFKAVTSHDRAGWEQFLDWRIKDMEKP
ncbi:MAG: tetratricopeptide repeat protein [Planctomycetota bacterium]|nr:tetratricopeptide repeat protein [Planctomycetota bacterium]